MTGISVIKQEEKSENKNAEYRSSFETFKSTVCHRVKDMGDIDFIITTLENDTIRDLYKRKWYSKSYLK